LPVAFRPRKELWTFAAPGETGLAPAGQSIGREVTRVLTSLADAVLDVLEEKVDYRAMGREDAFEEAVRLFSGNRLYYGDDTTDSLIERAGVSKDALEARLHQLEYAYGLSDLAERRYHRPARALLLLAAESRFVPIAEGVLAAIDWLPASARLDLRAAFHLVSRWWGHHPPQVAARMAVASLAELPTTNGHRPRPWRPLTKFYEAVLEPHRPKDVQAEEAQLLSAGTIGVLWDAYSSRATNSEVMLALFNLAEASGILDRRPSFDLEQEDEVRHVFTHLLLDLELGRQLDPSVAALLPFLGSGDGE